MSSMFKKGERAPSPHHKSGGSSKIPSYFTCPITLEMMEDPTITACGHMFDRGALVKWLKDEVRQQACPICHQRIDEAALAPCYPLKAAIAEFRANGGGSQEDVSKKQVNTVGRKIANLKVFGNGKSEESAPAPSAPVTAPARSAKRPQSTAGASASASMRIQSPPAAMDIPPVPPPSHSRESSRARKTASTVGRTRQPWARLMPLLHTYSPLEITKDEFTIGRASSCDQTYNFSELSNTHCLIYRVPREGTDGQFDYFLEDKSTNGTYVNGNRVGKGLIASIIERDEISLGERFCTKIIPKLPAFIDWVFSGSDITPEVKMDMESAKGIRSFHELIRLDDAGLRNHGVQLEYARKKILGSVGGWLEKYRFPAFRFEAVDSTRSPSVQRPMQQQGNGSSNSFSSPTMDRRVVETLCEVCFDPPTYTERVRTGMVRLVVRRKKSYQGSVTVNVRSTSRGTLRPGIAYQPLDKTITIADGAADGAVDFTWRPDTPLDSAQSINFELRIVSGAGRIGQISECMLSLEPVNVGRMVNHPDVNALHDLQAAGRVLAPHVQGTVGKQRQKQYVDPFQSSLEYNAPPQEQLENTGMDLKYSGDMLAGPSNGHDEHSRQLQASRVDDELLAIMMDSFPSLEASAISKVIAEERKMIAPLDDRNLLQDLVAIKLTNMTRGDANALELANIQMTKTAKPMKREEPHEERDSLGMNVHMISSDSGSKQPQAVSSPKGSPSVHPANRGPAGAVEQASQPSSSKLRQTILRSELQSFLLMASLSLVRKFFTIQGLDCSVTHHPSEVVTISSELTTIFLKSIESLRPVESGQTQQDDVFDFEKVVELFKKYVYSNGNELRARAKAAVPVPASAGYRYDVAFHKSSHHVKMENNHAVIEDLNAFAKLPSNQPMHSFYGVFDGHGGYLVSEYLSLHLATVITKQPMFTKNILEAMRLGYLKTDEQVMRKVHRDKLRGGSTAATVIIRENVLYTAWAGDARIVLFRRVPGGGLSAQPLITPHNPEGNEKLRVIKAGGFVEYIAGKWRVNGRLAVTRSFGDESLKPVVIADPELQAVPMQGNEQFLMLSCDGIYDVMSYKDVADYLSSCMANGMAFPQLAGALVNEAVTRGSTDDITSLLVDLSGRK